jgi:hypothetical protein
MRSIVGVMALQIVVGVMSFAIILWLFDFNVWLSMVLALVVVAFVMIGRARYLRKTDSS